MKQCTGCGRYDNEPLGLNTNGNPYLACCPDNNYVEVNTMKLYTEYDLKEVYFKGLDNGKNNIEGGCHNAIDSFTPIELPSDEEIVERSIYSLLDYTSYKSGAKWMKEQILNQNKSK